MQLNPSSDQRYKRRATLNRSLFSAYLCLKESGVANLHNANKNCFFGEIVGVPPTSFCSLGSIIKYTRMF